MKRLLIKAWGLAIIALVLTGAAGVSAGIVPAHSLYGAAHGVPSGLSTLYVIDETTGQATAIGPIGFTRVSGIAFHPTSGVLYGVGRRPGTETSVLITINLATGAGTEVGPTGVAALGFGPNVSDIAFRPSDGVLFAYLEAGDGVGTIDITTGAATALGASNSAGCCGNGIAFSSGGVLFHATDIPLNTLDQTTGQATEVVTLDYPAPADDDPRINAMDFNPATAVLYGSLNDGNPGEPENYLARSIPPPERSRSWLGP